MKIGKILVGAGLVAGAAEYGIARYFFRRTMIRGNAKVERTINMAGTDWEVYKPEIKRRREWLMTRSHEEVSIRSKDNLRLHGTFFPEEGSKKVVICFHGYTSQGVTDFTGLSKFYISMGYNMLMVDERAHGESEGTYIGFGCLDRFDAMEWINYINNRFKGECEILLHGISMGAATVLMVSGQTLPENVKGIVSDCAFTSAWDVFSSVLKNMYHMPPFPVMNLADQMAKKEAGYGLNECNAKEEVRKAAVPILFIHGDADTFVPWKMCDELYENCASKKQKLIIKGASHAEAYYKDMETYETAIKEFFQIEGKGN